MLSRGTRTARVLPQVISIPTAQLRAMGGTGQLIQLVPAGVTGGTGDVGTILINQGDSSTGHENAAGTWCLVWACSFVVAVTLSVGIKER